MRAASGTLAASAASTAALGAASGLFARSLAGATVRPGGHARAGAVSRSVLYAIGRDVIETGEHLSLIDMDTSARVRLLPVAAWDVTGGPDPETWRYALTLEGPSQAEVVTTSGAGVLHIRLSPDPRRPWRGRSPIAAETDRLAGGLERQLAGEAGGPGGKVFPVPTVGREGEAATQLAASLKTAAGGVVIQEQAAFSGRGSSLNEYGALAVRGGYQAHTPARLGIDPNAATVELRRDVFRSVLGAVGVPSDLFEPGPGGGQREAFRRFLHASAAPLAGLVGDAIGEALDIPDFALDLSTLNAADVMGRARAYGSLVGAGMDPADALEKTGL
ncbi:MAG: hypothetical protein OXJ54_07985 [Gemmatimonadetes bacterium]|nr:hypothetical protein [Candidatus Palauibacter rhopaloidicola]